MGEALFEVSLLSSANQRARRDPLIEPLILFLGLAFPDETRAAQLQAYAQSRVQIRLSSVSPAIL